MKLVLFRNVHLTMPVSDKSNGVSTDRESITHPSLSACRQCASHSAYLYNIMLSFTVVYKRIARWRSYIQLFVGRISIALSVSGGSWSPAVDGNAQLYFARFCWLHWNYAKPRMLLDYHQQLTTYPAPCSRKTVTSRKIIPNGQNRHGCFKLNE